MIEINELRLSAIGRFVEEQIIRLDKLGNLVQVDGVRNDTGGSSGSGKTTIFNALDYLLGLNDIPSSVLQSRFTKEPMSVTMIGKYIGKDLTITRGKGKLIVELDGEKISGNKLAEEKIDQILGMPRKLFRPLLHKRQKEGGFFLQFTPKEIHEFLTDCLGLSEIRIKEELVDKKIKELTNDANSTQSCLGQSLSALEATQNAILALGEVPIKEIDQHLILSLKKAYEAAQEVLGPTKSRHSIELATFETSKPKTKLVEVDQTHLKSLEIKLADVYRKIDEIVSQNAIDVKEERNRASQVLGLIQSKKLEMANLDHDVKNGVKSRSEADILATEIKKIRDSICPTCEQKWATEAAYAREAALIEKIKFYGNLIGLSISSSNKIDKLKQEILELTPISAEKSIPMPAEYSAQRIFQDEISTRINEERRRIRDTEAAEHHINRVLIEQFGQEQRSLMEKQQTELQQINGQIDITRRTFEAATHKIKSHEEARDRWRTSARALSEYKAKHEASIQEYSDKSKSLRTDLIFAEELKRAIKGYTSCSFDEALDYIGNAATEIIRAIPNMANATIQLEGIRETKDGKVKEEVNAVLSMDGELGIPIKSLSGGERSSVDLAVDLAVIDLLENRTNKGINLFILDEPFTGLDAVSIEMAIDKLKNLNKRLVIVDHNAEVKEMVESRLMVVREGLTSKIVQN